MKLYVQRRVNEFLVYKDVSQMTRLCNFTNNDYSLQL